MMNTDATVPYDTSANLAAPQVTKSNNRVLLVGLFLFIVIIIVGIASFFAGKRVGSSTASEELRRKYAYSEQDGVPIIDESLLHQAEDRPSEWLVQQTADATALTAISEPIMDDGFQSYEHSVPKNLPNSEHRFHGFQLIIPNDWKVHEQSDPETSEFSLQLTKANGASFEIIQAAGGGGYCLFPDQPEYATFDGYATQYQDFISIDKDNIQWRLATNSGDITEWRSHTLCESFESDMFKSGFMDSTSIGYTKITVRDKQSLAQLQKMLRTLTILD